jgi:hypothetical protein
MDYDAGHNFLGGSGTHFNVGEQQAFHSHEFILNAGVAFIAIEFWVADGNNVRVDNVTLQKALAASEKPTISVIGSRYTP